jgi:4-hydroxy-2-oxoheptanedioate aldolase
VEPVAEDSEQSQDAKGAINVTVNAMKRKIEAGGAALGAWCSLGSVESAEICATSGFDYVCVDLQHGLSHLDSMVPMLMAASRTGTTPTVRVPRNETDYIGKALDAGAEVVVVPMVNTAGEAERAVAACRYAPEGVRSFGPVRSRMFLSDADPVDVNREVLCMVMIETVEAVENVAEICKTPGLDGVYIGPADLAVSMGFVPSFGDPPAEEAEVIDHIRATCAAAGVIAGIHTGGGALARAYVDAGFRMVTVATDAAALRKAVLADLRAVAGGGGEAGGAGGGGYS